MLTKITNFVKENQDKIVLVLCMVLVTTLAFSLGYIYGKTQEKQPLRIEQR
ncbi:MAG: hypothetical protein PHH21_01670 [Candidatus Pacebacteria bacterium]|nr:hypothetical protein [Candidatus Paceibacterota bacterium]